jgi:hypothetical protein
MWLLGKEGWGDQRGGIDVPFCGRLLPKFMDIMDK